MDSISPARLSTDLSADAQAGVCVRRPRRVASSRSPRHRLSGVRYRQTDCDGFWNISQTPGELFSRGFGQIRLLDDGVSVGPAVPACNCGPACNMKDCTAKRRTMVVSVMKRQENPAIASARALSTYVETPCP